MKTSVCEMVSAYLATAGKKGAVAAGLAVACAAVALTACGPDADESGDQPTGRAAAGLVVDHNAPLDVDQARNLVQRFNWFLELGYDLSIPAYLMQGVDKEAFGAPIGGVMKSFMERGEDRLARFKEGYDLQCAPRAGDQSTVDCILTKAGYAHDVGRAVMSPETGIAFCELEEDVYPYPAVRLEFIVADNGTVTVGQHASLDGAVAETDEELLLINCGEPVCVDGSQELLRNGSFDERPIPGGWATVTEMPGWAINWVNPACKATPRAELQRNGFIVSGGHGHQYVELDSHHGCGWDARFRLSQSVSTQPGSLYQVSFLARRRSPNQGVMNLEVSWNDTLLVDEAPGDNWERYEFVVSAQSDVSVLRLADTGAPNTYGVFLDDVSVRPVSCVD